MNINRRQAALLKLLVSSTSYTPTIELARALSCSERTVRNDIQAVNAFLEKTGIAARTDSKRGNGLKIEIAPAERERVLGLVKEYALAMDPALDRFYRGILLLICDSTQNYTIETLARAILTNKQQAQDDIAAWNEMLAPYGASIQRKRHLAIAGPEENIRFFVAHNLFELAPTAMKRRIEPQLLGPDREFLYNEIDTVERALERHITDNARHEFATYLQVAILRIRKGHEVPSRAAAIPPVFTRFATNLERHYGVSLRSGERAVIVEVFSVAARQWTPDFQDSYTPSREAALIADDLYRSLGEHYDKRPPAHLYKPLALLIEAGALRQNLHRAIALPLETTWTVHFENMTTFMRICQIIRDTPSLAELSLYETDCTRVAMLLLNFMDDLSVSDAWRVGLVANCGVEQVFFARDRIERLLPFTRVVRVIPEQEQMEGGRALDGLDFLVSFDPIESTLPVALISNAITEEDRRHINDTILSISQQRAQGEATALDSLTSRELDCNDFESFIVALRLALIEDGLWRGAEEEFRSCFEMATFMCGPTLIFTLFSHEIAQTGSMIYEVDVQVPFWSTRVRHVAVLTVSPTDERILGAVSTTFRRQLVSKGLVPNKL